MNTFTSNPTAAETAARQLIQDRVQDAQRRRQVRDVRAARRAARQAYQPRPVTPPQSTHHMPWWAFRFLFPAR